MEPSGVLSGHDEVPGVAHAGERDVHGLHLNGRRCRDDGLPLGGVEGGAATAGDAARTARMKPKPRAQANVLWRVRIVVACMMYPRCCGEPGRRRPSVRVGGMKH